ncbi:TonB-dependent receptor domain-containing protein [Necropsobacter massiliensis]|uniref:TonB-dependent receptor domain-containing protein n=1 Tax=Necropsobacter massiliensis TaxID=1400001 RepID=UPI000596166F|nr:TonB-dependent receptor [Necropsobacter massiliensis]
MVFRNTENYRKLILTALLVAVNTTSHAQKGSDQLDVIEVKSSSEQQDEQRKDEVYLRNITNMYADKETVERYKGATPADLFQGFNGVYSGDARNSGAVDPNIRGIQGEGRIPVTIDGTEQAITTWRGYNGANNRNYLDPNLIAGITVEKGPDIASGNASGIGGAIKMRTIDVDDILKPGQRVGAELKLEASNNSVKERIPDFDNGKDCRETGQCILGFFSPHALIKPKTKGSWGHDNAMRLAVGLREDKFDLLAAYSYRSKGNYLAGKGGAHNYEGDIDIKGSDISIKQMEPNLPFAATIYRPHTEVPNTSSLMESYLLKTTVRPTKTQQIKLGYRHTKTTYGEIMPSRLDFRSFHGFIPQWPLSTVKQSALNFDYAYNPEDNDWLDLKLGLWYTRTDSLTNTSGGNPREINDPKAILQDPAFYQWFAMTSSCVQERQDWTSANSGRDVLIVDYACLHRNGDPIVRQHPNTGKYTLVNSAQMQAHNTRRGVNLSNVMKLTDKLDLTFSGALQREHLTSSNPGKSNRNDGFTTYEAPPRLGRRQEWDIALNFHYRPTDWLALTAGGRYNEYWSYDDYLAELLNSGELSTDTITVGQEINYDRVLSKKEWDTYLKANADFHNLNSSEEKRNEALHTLLKMNCFGHCENGIVSENKAISWRYHSDGRLHREDNPFYNGTLKNELVKNPKTGKTEYKYQKRITGPIEEKLKKEELLKSVKKQRGHAFSPAFSATAFLTDHSRVYLRYVQYARMPSIFETTIGFSASPGTSARFKDAKLKPEKARNIELGYAYDFGHWFATPTKADIKLSYYHNVTKNVIDRDTEFRFIQLDKRKLEGIELQARYDNGDYFADLGFEYHLKNKVCDANTAVELDPVELRLPKCMTGGFPMGYLRTQLQPKYSISANIGGRFFERKLEIGSRWLYHSKAVNKDEQRIYEQGLDKNNTFWNWNRPMSWQPVLVVDAYIRYAFSPDLSIELTGTNLTDRYYLDPMTRSMIPAPGRTFKLGLTAKF